MAMGAPTPSVLIADEDPASRQSLLRFFRERAWFCDCASSGNQALAAAASRQYDLVITELVMPGLGGLALLKKLHDEQPSQAVIVVSGSQPIADAGVFFRVGGAIDFLEKPIDTDLLAASVERVVTGARQEEFQTTIARNLVEGREVYRLTSRQLAQIRFPFVLAERLFAAGRIDRNSKLRLELAFQEALANSLEHGNLELQSIWKEEIDAHGCDRFSKQRAERLKDPKYADRYVILSIEFRDDTVSLRFEDQGKGFLSEDRKIATGSFAMPSALTPEVHGRGISIIRGIMDHVEYTEYGRVLTMRKFLD